MERFVEEGEGVVVVVSRCATFPPQMNEAGPRGFPSIAAQYGEPSCYYEAGGPPAGRRSRSADVWHRICSDSH